METLQRHFYSLEKQPHYTVSTFSTSSSPSAASSLTDSQDDLLPDLWLQPSSPQPPSGFGTSMASHAPLNPMATVASPSSMMNATSPHSALGGYTDYHLSAPAMQGNMMLREASLEYAQLLLPHSLLVPLTEENLDYNLARVASGPNVATPVANGSDRVAGAHHHHHHHHHDHNQNNNQNQHIHHHDIHHDINDFQPEVTSDDIFNFEQQQAQQQTRPHHNNQKSRQGSVSSSGSSKGKNINTQLYKTELCVSFIKMGVCPYGNKCQFAHGEHDLKVVERPANWRSKPCANWAKFGSCRYGKRCCFKHGD
ncbi:CIC11C00000004309 [Sungouiella intermedia]|uniref:CIC11C00000004309 n=1 Tax=Sungouiella intermedia TaxID=45354 RepID=A0A1L0BCP8_9ASCO|nr:CIC11C00000004309 [[Candida] intermedia]